MILGLQFTEDREWVPEFGDHTSGVHVWRTPEGAPIAYGCRADEYCWMYWPGLATYRFAASHPRITAFPEPSARRDVVWDVYRRSVLPMALQALGWEALHASAILTSGGVVGFCAISGTGKSTLAFGLQRLGYRQWSDDALVLDFSEDTIRAVPLPFEARLRSGAAALFGNDARYPTRYQDNGRGQQQSTEPCGLRALCVLSRVDDEQFAREPRLTRLSPASTFPALLTHAHVFDPLESARRLTMLERYLDVAAAVPVFEVRFAADPSGIEDLLNTVVSGLGLDTPVLTLARA